MENLYHLLLFWHLWAVRRQILRLLIHVLNLLYRFVRAIPRMIVNAQLRNWRIYSRQYSLLGYPRNPKKPALAAGLLFEGTVVGMLVVLATVNLFI